MERLRYLKWRWLQRTFWFQRRKPHREYETRIYEGLPGSGKTLALAADGIKLLRLGIPVYSNFRIYDPIAQADGSILESQPVGGWGDILRRTVEALENGTEAVFLIDELHVIASSQDRSMVPDWLMWLLTQRRHFGIGIMGSTQDLGQIQSRVRALVDRVVRVRPFFRRFPQWGVFEYREIDLRAYDQAENEERGYEIDFIPWYAYKGYDTSELCAIDKMSGYKDDEVKAEIHALTMRALDAARLRAKTSEVYYPLAARIALEDAA